MEYLLKLAQALPGRLGRKKVEDLLQIANKYQVRLGKVKQVICKHCHTLLTPKVSSEAKLEKRACGLGISVKCSNCTSSTFTVRRNG